MSSQVSGSDVAVKRLKEVDTFKSNLQMAALQAIRLKTKMDALLLFRKIWELQKGATIAKANQESYFAN